MGRRNEKYKDYCSKIYDTAKEMIEHALVVKLGKWASDHPDITAFIDVFIQRFAKGAAAILILVTLKFLPAGYVSALTLVLAVHIEKMMPSTMMVVRPESVRSFTSSPKVL